MKDNLPLIAQKNEAICEDVVGVLREVFRDLRTVSVMPPPPAPPPGPLPKLATLRTGNEFHRTITGSVDEIINQVDYTRKLIRPMPENLFTIKDQLTKVSCDVCEMDCTCAHVPHESRLIERNTVLPTLQQDVGRDKQLWISNVLDIDPCSLRDIELRGQAVPVPPVSSEDYLQYKDLPKAVNNREYSAQSVSIGTHRSHRRERPPKHEKRRVPTKPKIVCVPPRLDYINFVPGKKYTQVIRIINTSNFEVHLSLRPPARLELNIEICSHRGLAITPGADAYIAVRFKPVDNLSLYDALTIRATTGETMTIPIDCYHLSPILHIMVPYVPWTSINAKEIPNNNEWCPLEGYEILDLGTKLLGEVHHSKLVIHSFASHAEFFFLTEEAWMTCLVDQVSETGTMKAGDGIWTLCPFWFQGGGTIEGAAWFIAPFVGFHTTPLRILSSTTIIRPLHMVADSLAFSLHHISIKAQDKDFDILWEDDEQCQYYVNLGISFPCESTSSSIFLENHSPVVYSFYWVSRPWNVCSCWKEDRYKMQCPEPECDSEAGEHSSIELSECAAAVIMRERSQHNDYDSLMRISPEHGEIAPRSTILVSVKVPNVGSGLGIKQGVYMLILKDVPKASLPKNQDINILSTRKLMLEHVPGVQPSAIEVCDIVCCQIEVWWETVPIRFMLDPPLMLLPQSRRLEEPIDVEFHATQLYGKAGFPAFWTVPKGVTPVPRTMLSPHQSIDVNMQLPIIETYNEIEEELTVRLTSDNKAWYCESKIIRSQDRLYPKLEAPYTWLGRLLPNTFIKHQLQVINDTKQRIGWWASVVRWLGGRPVKRSCQMQGSRCTPCCQDRNCSCDLLLPLSGCLDDKDSCDLQFQAYTPNKDGPVICLVDVTRTELDVGHVWRTPDNEGRASLIAYRVQSPNLYLTLKNAPGIDEHSDHPNYHMLDNSGNTGILRPLRPLPRGKSATYLMYICNTTPMPTKLYWQKQIEGERNIKVTFEPNDIDITPFANIEVKVTIEGVSVSRRRVWYYAGISEHLYRPLYLMIEIEISGFEVIVDIPLGDGQEHNGYAEIRRTEREIPLDPLTARRESCDHAGNCYICKSKPVEDICGKEKPADLWELDPDTLFTMEDKKKKAGKQRMCRCVKEEVYIPPKPMPTPEYEDDYPPIDIITSPRTTCICKCITCGGLKPVLPEYENLSCIQYRSLKVFKEVTRRLKIRNTSELKSKYSIIMRRFAMGATKSKFRGGGVVYPGLAIWFHKYQGVIEPEAVVDIDMNIYADCFGLYYDQILIKMDYVTPIIIDVWVETIGSPLLPLSFNLNPIVHPMTLPTLPDQEDIESIEKPTLWVSDNDEKRTIRVRNVSRTPILVRPFIAKNREPFDPILPFRLYLSFLDELPRFCPCILETDTILSETLSTNLTSHSTKDKSYTESKTESKWDSKTESKWDSKTESKWDTKTESKLDSKTESKWDSKSERKESKVEKEYTRDEMDTRIIVYLGPDYGKQDYTYYALCSEELVTVEPDAIGEFSIMKAEDDDYIDDELDEIIDPKFSLLLTMEPIDICGKGWYRFNMDPLVVNIRRAARAPQLQLDTDKITAYINATELPFDDTMRIRKYIHLMNTGTGPMTLNIKTDGPWWILENKLQADPSISCGHGCRCRWLADPRRESYPKHTSIYLKLPPYSSYQMCLEIEINTNSIWPKALSPTTQWMTAEKSELTLLPVNNVSERKLFNNKLQFYKDQDLIKMIPLDLAIDYPRLIVDPVTIDFGFVTDGDTKKTYFTIKHTSRTLPLDISCEWIGSVDVKHYPRHLHISPEDAGRVYVQYTARWTSAPLEGRFMIKVYSGASMWCQATLPVRATPTRDHKFKTAIHDHTDDKVILPPLKILDHLLTK